MEKKEILYKNMIEILESLYLKKKKKKRNKILEYDILEEDEHIDEWNKKKVKKDENDNKE